MESIEECAKMEIEAFEEKLHYDDSISDTLDSDKLSLLHYERLHYDDSIPLHYDDSIPLHYDDSIPVPNPFNNWRHGHSILDPNVFSNWSRQDHILDPNVFWNWRRQDRVRDPNVFWNWSRQDHILDPNTFKNRSFEECAKMEIEAFAKKPVYRVVRDPNEFKNWSIEECAKRNLELSKKRDTKAFKVASVRHFVQIYNHAYIRSRQDHILDPNAFTNLSVRHFVPFPITYENMIYNHAHVLDPNTYENRIDDILEPRWHYLLIMALFVPIMALFAPPRWLSLLDPNAFNNWRRGHSILVADAPSRG